MIASLMLQLGVDLTGSGFYAVIDRVEYDKSKKTAVWLVDIYANKAARDAEGIVVDRYTVNIQGDDFDAQIGSNGLSIGLAYATTMTHAFFTDWESDE